jgi:hypothetical protein
MNEANVSTERRKHLRMKTSIPVRFRREGDETGAGYVGSLTSDVSEDGLRFTTNECISAPCRLILELDVPTQTKPMQAMSQVAWVKDMPVDKAMQYEVGNRFMEITSKDQERISQYIKSL